MPAVVESNPPSARFTGAAIEAERLRAGVAYLEFLRTPLLSLGMDVLEPGPGDTAKTHTEDEVYIVLEGAGMFEAGDQSGPASPGDVFYVRRAVLHRFHDITKTMRIAVVFAPPYESLIDRA